MEIKIIGKNGCSRCNMTKTILTNKGINFSYLLLDELSQEKKDLYLTKAQEKGLLNLPLIIKNEEIVELQEVI